MTIFTWVFSALGDGHFWLGLIAGALLGSWLVTQSESYRQFDAAEQKKQRDALFKKYLDSD